MFAGLLAALLVASQLPLLQLGVRGLDRAAWRCCPGRSCSCVLGMVDDKWGLDAPTKFAGQALAGAVMALQGHRDRVAARSAARSCSTR